MHVPAEIGLKRIMRKKSLLERLELQRQVREEYLKLARAGGLVLVDSNQPIERVSEAILALVEQCLKDLRV